MEAGGAAPGGTAEAKNSVKNSWPEVVGLSSEEAMKKIGEDKPDASIYVVPPGTCVTCDYHPGRIWVIVDSNDKVTRAPKIG